MAPPGWERFQEPSRVCMIMRGNRLGSVQPPVSTPTAMCARGIVSSCRGWRRRGAGEETSNPRSAQGGHAICPTGVNGNNGCRSRCRGSTLTRTRMSEPTNTDGSVGTEKLVQGHETEGGKKRQGRRHTLTHHTTPHMERQLMEHRRPGTVTGPPKPFRRGH